MSPSPVHIAQPLDRHERTLVELHSRSPLPPGSPAPPSGSLSQQMHKAWLTKPEGQTTRNNPNASQLFGQRKAEIESRLESTKRTSQALDKAYKLLLERESQTTPKSCISNPEPKLTPKSCISKPESKLTPKNQRENASKSKLKGSTPVTSKAQKQKREEYVSPYAQSVQKRKTRSDTLKEKGEKVKKINYKD